MDIPKTTHAYGSPSKNPRLCKFWKKTRLWKSLKKSTLMEVFEEINAYDMKLMEAFEKN